MKLLISLLLLFPSLNFAREIILIEQKENFYSGNIIKEILISEHGIPGEFIAIRTISNRCSKKAAVMHICLYEEGKITLHDFNQKLVMNTLGDFKNFVDGLDD